MLVIMTLIFLTMVQNGIYSSGAKTIWSVMVLHGVYIIILL